MTLYKTVFLLPSILLFFLVASLWPKPILAAANSITRQTGGMVFSSDSKALIMVAADPALPDQSTFSLTPKSIGDLISGNSIAKLTVMQMPKSLTSVGASQLYEIDAQDLGNGQHFTTYPKPFTIVLPLELAGDGSTNIENQDYQAVFYDATAKKWQVLPTSVLTNAKNKTAAFVAQKVGIYGVVKNSSVLAAKDVKNANIDGCHYIVEKGDSLWSITQNRLGNGILYQKIIDQNKRKYPTLASDTTLQIGWDLKVDCNT